MLKPEFKTIEVRKLVGMQITTNLQDDNSTAFLWQGFMPIKSNVKSIVNEDLYSFQEYDAFVAISEFNETSTFRKWAAIEVENYNTIPAGMETIEIPSGEYAVFTHKGPTSTFVHTAQQIFNFWLPNYGLLLDDRPQFEIMGEKYKGAEHPLSEEEIWVPIKKA